MFIGEYMIPVFHPQNTSGGSQRKPIQLALPPSESLKTAAMARAQNRLGLARMHMPQDELELRVAATCEVMKVQKRLDKGTGIGVLQWMDSLVQKEIGRISNEESVIKAQNVICVAHNQEAKEKLDLLNELADLNIIRPSELRELLTIGGIYFGGFDRLFLAMSGDLGEFANALVVLAETYLDFGRPDLAKISLQRAEVLYEQQGVDIVDMITDQESPSFSQIKERLEEQERTGQTIPSRIRPFANFECLCGVFGMSLSATEIIERLPENWYAPEQRAQTLKILGEEWAALENQPDAKLRIEARCNLCFALAILGQTQDIPAYARKTLSELQLANTLENEPLIIPIELIRLAMAKLFCGEVEQALQISNDDPVRLAVARYYAAQAMQALDEAGV